MKHLQIEVSGKVQGVGFREATREQAGRLGLTGHVRNEPDGGVRIEAEGEASTLDLLLRWLKHGPAPARVDELSVTEGPLQGYSAFQVER